MNDYTMANLLARTYYHCVTAYRPQADGTEMRVCEAVPCALSRSAHTSAPTPPDGEAALPEARYRLSLYTRPEMAFQLGDRLEISDGTGCVWHGWASDSFPYPSHCITVVEIDEVRDAVERRKSDKAAVPGETE